jgi:hypothetical protein
VSYHRCSLTRNVSKTIQIKTFCDYFALISPSTDILHLLAPGQNTADDIEAIATSIMYSHVQLSNSGQTILIGRFTGMGASASADHAELHAFPRGATSGAPDELFPA